MASTPQFQAENSCQKTIAEHIRSKHKIDPTVKIFSNEIFLYSRFQTQALIREASARNLILSLRSLPNCPRVPDEILLYWYLLLKTISSI